ncbi:MAG: DNA-binding protein [Limnohabitans sp.]|nr:DNA-binding protein [Limnohabitans sp.]
MSSNTPTSSDDWTRGGSQLMRQHCRSCSHVWYFFRQFCPACGSDSPLQTSCNPIGVVCAATLVHRAPDERFKDLVPYRLVLVDMHDGVCVMGHGEPALQIGDSVRCDIQTLAGQPLPFFKLQQP